MRRAVASLRDLAVKQGYYSPECAKFVELTELLVSSGTNIAYKGVAIADLESFQVKKERKSPIELFKFLVDFPYVFLDEQYVKAEETGFLDRYPELVDGPLAANEYLVFAGKGTLAMAISDKRLIETYSSGGDKFVEKAKKRALDLLSGVSLIERKCFDLLMKPAESDQSQEIRELFTDYFAARARQTDQALWLVCERSPVKMIDLYRRAVKISASPLPYASFYKELADRLLDYLQLGDESVWTVSDLEMFANGGKVDTDRNLVNWQELKETVGAIVRHTDERQFSLKKGELCGEWKLIAKPEEVMVRINKDRPTSFSVTFWLKDTETEEELAMTVLIDLKNRGIDWNLVDDLLEPGNSDRFVPTLFIATKDSIVSVWNLIVAQKKKEAAKLKEARAEIKITNGNGGRVRVTNELAQVRDEFLSQKRQEAEAARRAPPILEKRESAEPNGGKLQIVIPSDEQLREVLGDYYDQRVVAVRHQIEDFNGRTEIISPALKRIKSSGLWRLRITLPNEGDIVRGGGRIVLEKRDGKLWLHKEVDKRSSIKSYE